MGVSPFHGFDDRTHVGRQNMEFEQHSMYRRIHGVKSTMDTKLVRLTLGPPPSPPPEGAHSIATDNTASARSARGRRAR